MISTTSHRRVVTDLDLEAREHGTTVLVEPVDDHERAFDDRPCGDGHSPWDLHERTVQGRPYIGQRPMEDRRGWRTLPKRRVPEGDDLASCPGGSGCVPHRRCG